MNTQTSTFIVYYHRRGQKKTPYNQMRMKIRAKSTDKAIEKARKELGRNWTVEKASLYSK